MTTATEQTTITTTVSAPLTINDSCDQCGEYADTNTMGQEYFDRISQAYVRVILPSGKQLLFCGHHYATNELALAAIGATVANDQRAELTVKPGHSA